MNTLTVPLRQRQPSWLMPLLLMLWVGITGLSALAQIGTGTIRGTVTDEQGAAVAGATVTLTSSATGTTRTQTTNEAGTFSFTGVPVAAYTVKVESPNFKTYEQADIRARVDGSTTLDIILTVGAATETITVTGDGTAAIVNRQDASIGNTIAQRQILELPLAARNIAGLLSLQPGVTRDGSVSGSRSDQGNITLDGVDINEQQNNTAFAPVLRTSPESVEEFRVTVSNPNANQGRSSGAQISLVTKSGTNEFHGSAFFFHRPTIGNAGNWFTNAIGQRTPRVLQNVFGGAVGGPIVKNRLFFFYNYEGRRDRSQTSVLRTVPLPHLGRGELRFNAVNAATGAPVGIVTLTAAQISQAFPALAAAGGGSALNPAGVAYLAQAASRYPANDPGAGDGVNTGGFRFNAPTPFDFNAHIGRLDWKVDDAGKHTLFARANVQYDTILQDSFFPDTAPLRTWSHPVGIAAGHTWTISNNWVNNFRYGLTRFATSNQGDTAQNFINFRFVFEPTFNQRTLDRIVPTHNFTNDTTYVFRDHTFQFGTNIRIIRNRRTGFGQAFDFGVVNPIFYAQSLTAPINTFAVNNLGLAIQPGRAVPVRDGVNALIGRINQYTVFLTYDQQGRLLPAGSPTDRSFAAEEYDFYFQDVWRIRPNLTLTYGIRYGLSRPVYEQNGFQAGTNIPLGDFLRGRAVGAAQGRPFNDLITINLAGPVNGGESLYQFAYNNWQPRVSIAWSPDFKEGFLGKVFGKRQESVIRAGFALTNDYFGQQIAVQFDQRNTLGFVQQQQTSFAQFRLTSPPFAPLFTAQGQSFRNFPGINPPPQLRFPLTQPDDGQQRIEQSIDQTTRLPRNFSWNFSYGRELPAGLFVEASYVGRLGRNLLAQRDVMALNNLVDPRTGVDWYTAAGQLEDLRRNNTPISQIPNIPYFNNILFPGILANFFGGFGGIQPGMTNSQAIYAMLLNPGSWGLLGPADWTTVQLILNNSPRPGGYQIDGISPLGEDLFFHPQYGALNTIGSFGTSDYHGLVLTMRQRYKTYLTWDFNYTFSKSLDDASGLQTAGFFGGGGLVLNPFRQRDNRAVSSFDFRHIINANFVVQLPFGRGRAFFGNASRVLDAFIGGWQLGGIARYNSGQVTGAATGDGTAYATNWQVPSNAVRIRQISTSPTRGNNPNLFRDPVFASQSFRSAKPGETGERNIFRLPAFANLDISLAKSFTMPWSEQQSLQFRWEVFNATNFQPFGGVQTLATPTDPFRNQPLPNFGRLTSVQNPPRFMQFVLRYVF
ncbi:carboxypeptidase regulatory-like domain-containing protein [Chloracidobacterium validum]|uniref:Carboxypeptidase regulatory-like domain-containing protein n=1 Tax=Chloracidobacterium validum TaxID=2821543 RepID=A0ABX8BEX0_9BACT|nr:carboxypeptidase-like regulatory domain-containing protein [Chloracidobacterium validum]QUW04214.1 carboxypeptidase regulatory-like domain-containing protein [Chloracidobacterium validum]